MNARNQALILVTALSALLARPTPATARLAFMASIELKTTGSDTIVLGNVTSVAPGDTWQTSLVTIQVKETLKGSIEESREGDGGPVTAFIRKDGAPFDKLEEWRSRKTDVLFFLTTQPNNPDAQTGERRLGSRLTGSVLALDDRDQDRIDQQAITMDFDILTTREEILRAVRAGCSTSDHDNPRRSLVLDIIPESSPLGRRLGDGRPFLRLRVPCDERLERLGKEWAVRDPTGLRYMEGAAYRCLAARVLYHFPSDDNLQIVLRFLTDDLHYTIPDDDGGVTHYYLVRHDAYNTLRFWGVETKEPIEQIHIPKVIKPREVFRGAPAPEK